MDILEIFSDYPNPKAMLKLSKPAPHMGRLPKANLEWWITHTFGFPNFNDYSNRRWSYDMDK